MEYFEVRQQYGFLLNLDNRLILNNWLSIRNILKRLFLYGGISIIIRFMLAILGRSFIRRQFYTTRKYSIVLNGLVADCFEIINTGAESICDRDFVLLNRLVIEMGQFNAQLLLVIQCHFELTIQTIDKMKLCFNGFQPLTYFIVQNNY